MAMRLSRLPTAPMQRIVMDILHMQRLTDAFHTAPEFHLRLENQPYMPLVIERHGDEVAIMHYFIQNDDLMRDPELTFRLPDWSPTSITQDPVGTYRGVFLFVNGRRVMNTRLAHELETFARLWAINLRAQGFVNADRVTAISLTHAQLLPKPVST